MKKLTIKKAEALPLKEDVLIFQSINKLELPETFIEFLTTQNPIYVEESLYVMDGREPYYISFFPFSQDSEAWTIQKSFNNLKEFLEEKYLAFGSDSGGWQYVISVQNSDFGKVYFCRMDEELSDALTLLSDSFEDFINGLEKRVDEPGV